MTSTETSEGEKARPSAIAPMAVRIMAAPLCAVIGGPVFGAVGRLWWRGPGRLRGLGAAVLAAASLAEAALLGLRGRHYPHVGRWLLATIPAAVVAELALGLVYDQSF